ncbi:MAG: NAD-dependent epimerase/dehydratase family protein [Verrucomicrobiota bacterium]
MKSTEFKIDTTPPVLVTGATGYLAGWIVKKLLEGGATVHATVRDPSRTEKFQYLNDIAAATPGTIRFFKAELLDKGSFAEAMEGCGVVFHTASPFATLVDDPQRDLIDPAKLGTRNVLEQANQTASVNRVVLTSSCAAIYGDNADVANAPGGILTEEVWNTSSSVDHQPYSYSKTVAEQEAWKIADAQDRWRLVVINPSFILGPAVNPDAGGESMSLMTQFGDGTMKSGTADLGMGMVDIREVSQAHLAAAFLPDAEGRHIVSGYNSSFLELARMLHANYGDRFPVPGRAAPKWLLWLIGSFVNKAFTRKVVSRNVGVAWKADNRKSRERLGINYRPLEKTVCEMFQQLIDAGRLSPAKG